jgi:hypothetical protein
MFPHDSGTLYIIFKLIDLGLPEEMIDRAMEKIAGTGWKSLSLSLLRNRLRENGFHIQPDMKIIVDELEALILGTIKLDDIYTGHP